MTNKGIALSCDHDDERDHARGHKNCKAERAGRGPRGPILLRFQKFWRVSSLLTAGLSLPSMVSTTGCDGTRDLVAQSLRTKFFTPAGPSRLSGSRSWISSCACQRMLFRLLRAMRDEALTRVTVGKHNEEVVPEQKAGNPKSKTCDESRAAKSMSDLRASEPKWRNGSCFKHDDRQKTCWRMYIRLCWLLLLTWLRSSQARCFSTRRTPQRMSTLGVKRTCIALHMSAFDPKRTLNVQVGCLVSSDGLIAATGRSLVTISSMRHDEY